MSDVLDLLWSDPIVVIEDLQKKNDALSDEIADLRQAVALLKGLVPIEKQFWTTTLPKPISEMTRAELIERNKLVKGTTRVPSTERIPKPTYEVEEKLMKAEAARRNDEWVGNMSVTFSPYLKLNNKFRK